LLLLLLLDTVSECHPSEILLALIDGLQDKVVDTVSTLLKLGNVVITRAVGLVHYLIYYQLLVHWRLDVRLGWRQGLVSWDKELLLATVASLVFNYLRKNADVLLQW